MKEKMRKDPFPEVEKPVQNKDNFFDIKVIQLPELNDKHKKSFFFMKRLRYRDVLALYYFLFQWAMYDFMENPPEFLNEINEWVKEHELLGGK